MLALLSGFRANKLVQKVLNENNIGYFKIALIVVSIALGFIQAPYSLAQEQLIPKQNLQFAPSILISMIIGPQIIFLFLGNPRKEATWFVKFYWWFFFLGGIHSVVNGFTSLCLSLLQDKLSFWSSISFCWGLSTLVAAFGIKNIIRHITGWPPLPEQKIASYRMPKNSENHKRPLEPFIPKE